jgi:ectoine hydroxylase-related dioxygenase (phytanoyl-CoA dioxygenase family)
MSVLTESQKRQYREEGWCIAERVISPEHLELLQGQCQRFIDAKDAEMDAAGATTMGINHKGKRYFISNCFREEPRLRDFLFSGLMADICRQTIGDTAYLFWEQYVVKGAGGGTKFSWHQDSGYVGYPDHKPYLTCWCALDDMTEENGTVRVLPFPRLGIRTWVQHVKEEGSNDEVGYFGSDPGIPAIVPAGSIVLFSSVTFHASSANTSGRMRRAYLAQYSVEPLLTADGSKLWGNAEPLLRDGRIVAGEAAPAIESWDGHESTAKSMTRRKGI